MIWPAGRGSLYGPVPTPARGCGEAGWSVSVRGAAWLYVGAAYMRPARWDGLVSAVHIRPGCGVVIRRGRIHAARPGWVLPPAAGVYPVPSLHRI